MIKCPNPLFIQPSKPVNWNPILQKIKIKYPHLHKTFIKRV